ncbi:MULTISPECIES: methyl-accepting chemotaxis protein [unclassified Candidatus Frackibacter]|uniref:methyl-accepting chemotaxis protein n=1 Tax=unclassified Candidatus Frackibacter TaxID=2648818 RepID=UPI00087E2FB6|nr:MULTISPECIES: methyl-accepting chemotaxis protein [unclassified Candidatus Frackibacter]SDC04036.1 methyl-accepting chemotaxis protein [Candidatus Frackibacter sp. WG11]SEM68410.1 methyl-accepting chemotaxis protein [Candidatus Frackibacter sp. WG12]SFL79702.1 methyl-accepting chemotaxis protein [Candidatus Frackibacter sp. WG13]
MNVKLITKIKKMITKNLLFKTLFFSGIVGLIGLLVLGGFAYRITKTELRESSEMILNAINHELYEHIVDEFEERKEDASNIKNEIKARIQKSNQSNFAERGKSGYTYIIDKEGDLVFHPSKEGENIAGYEFVNEILKKKEGEIYYNWQGEEKYATYSYIPALDWIIVTSCYIDDMTASAQRVGRIILFLSILAIAVMGIGAVFVTRHITEPINELFNIIEEAEEGNLTARVDFNGREDELGQLGASFNRMLDQIVCLIKDAADTSDEVANVSTKLSSISEEASMLSKQASYTTDEMAQGAEKQSTQLGEISEIMSQISSVTEETAAQAEHAQNKAIDTLDRAQAGDEAVSKVINKMNKIQNTVEDSAEVVYKLGEKSNQIGEIIEIISNIAKQTDLLALNAAIEAARAGEHGQGFAVVADEVRKLAEESRESAEKVTDIINEIQSETDEAVNAIEEGTKEVTEGEELANEAGETLRNIMEFMEGTVAMIEDISSGAEEQSANTQQVASSVNEITAVAEQTAAGAQENLALAEEQTTSADEVSELAKVLNNKVDELDCKINRFTLSDDKELESDKMSKE